ncbi:MAG: hypothetical protein N5P05_001807 [Chroococcopsis gigantea SAG 12.99]|jgi:uncharacterized protein YoxC|nr:hypothetical protein [Chroococcopsis gigantea SAG 12.99]
MNFLLKNFKKLALTGVIALLSVALFLSTADGAIALPTSQKSVNAPAIPGQNLPLTGKPETAPEKPEFTLPEPLEKARLSYEKAVQKTNNVIDGLAAQLAGSSPDKDIIEDQQDDLENAADKLDDLAEKVGKFGKKLFNNPSATVSEGVQKNLQALKQGLDNAAQTIDILADDTEKAKNGASPFLKNRISQGIDAVKESLQASDRALSDLISTVKTQLQDAV